MAPRSIRRSITAEHVGVAIAEPGVGRDLRTGEADRRAQPTVERRRDIEPDAACGARNEEQAYRPLVRPNARGDDQRVGRVRAEGEGLFAIDDEAAAVSPCDCVHVVAGVAGAGLCVTERHQELAGRDLRQ